MAVSSLRLAWHLPCAPVAAKLDDVFIDLPQPRCPDRFATGEAPPVGVDGQRPSYFSSTRPDPVFLVTIRAEAILGKMHHFGPCLGILKLRDIDLIRPDAGHLESCLR